MIDKSYIKQSIKIKIKYLQNICSMFRFYHSIQLDKNKNYAFIFFAADYNNLGDLAITYAQELFIKKAIKNKIEIIKIPESETYLWVKKIKKLSINNVLITMIGGGNNGSLYEFIEEPRRFVLKSLKNYRIISFPQTVIFENTSKALPYREEFIRLCEKCNNLTMVAREEMSYLFYKRIKNIKVLLVPDIVFSIQPKLYNFKRKGIAFIFRNDKEKALDLDLQKKYIEIAKSQFNNIFYWDTCDIKYKDNNSKDLLDEFLERLQSIQVAITDRLHGMIFCYITHTPCIVFDNNNNKIKSTYDTWMKNQNFIKMFNPNDNLSIYQSLLNEIITLKDICDNDVNLKFDDLINSIS